MKNRTVVIIKEGQGEYDSYFENIIGVYIVPRKSFDIQLEHTKYLLKKIKELTDVEVEWKKYDHSEGLHYPKKLNRSQHKALRDIIKKYNVITFLETELKVKSINSSEYLM